MRSNHITSDISKMFALIFVFCLIFAGCGSGGGGGKTKPPNNVVASGKITGQAIKGPVSGGTVTAYAVTSGAKGAVLGTAITDANGNYSISIGNYSGPVFLEVTGGSYTDEATGIIISLPSPTGLGLQAVIDNVSAGSSVQHQITPLTTIAAVRAENMSGGLTPSNINAANQEIGTYFGGVDIVNTKPMNPMGPGSSSGAAQEAIDYGLILGGLSQQAQTLGLSNPMTLLVALANDLSDGVADGQKDGVPIPLTDNSFLAATASGADLALAIIAFNGDTSRNRSGGSISPILVAHLASSTLNVAIDPAGTGSGTVLSIPAGIDCGGDCSQVYSIDTMVTLTATPASGSVFAGWSGVCSGVGGCVVSMNISRSVTARFDLAPPHNVTLDVTIDLAGTGSGIVSSNPAGIDCGGDCSQNYLAGALVTLTAAPASGSVFVGWGGACSGSGGCVVAMNTDRSVIAKFALPLFPVDVGHYLEFDSHDSSSPPIEWTMRSEFVGEVTIGFQTYAQLMAWGHGPASNKHGLYRSTEDVFYGHDGINEFVVFQLAPVGTKWSYYSKEDGLSGQEVVEIISIGSVNVPYGTFTNAYGYRKYWDPDDPNLPNSPQRDEFVVPGVGVVKIVDYWVDSNAPTVHELTQHGFSAGGYSMADLAGTWYSMNINTPQNLFSNPDSFGFDVDTMTLQNDGAGTITCNSSSDSCSVPYSTSEVYLSSGGVLTTPPDDNITDDMVMSENKDKMIQLLRNNSPGEEHQVFSTFVKKAASYSMADLTGTWYSIDIITPQKGFSNPDYFGFDFDTMTLQNDGAGVYTCNASSDPCGAPEAISPGMISLLPDGIVTTLLGPNEAENFVMGENKDIMIQIHRNNNMGEEHQVFAVFVKKAASYSMTDLAGTWYSMKISTPQKGFSNPDYFGFDFDTMSLQSDGTGMITCIASSDPCNPPEALSGVSISADGIVTVPLNSDEAHDMVMGENKDVMVRIFRDNSAGNEAQAFTIFVRKAD